MIILDTAGDSIQAEASAASSITVSCYGIETASGTDTYKRLGVSQLTGGGTQDTIYTVPASTVTICSVIVIANTSGTARTVKLWDVENGGSPGDANAILGTVDIAANSTIVWNKGNIQVVPAAVAGTHAMLDGIIHNDSVADAVTRGSIIYGNATPKWDELVIGAADTFLGSDGTDLSYRTAAQVMASLSGEAGAGFSFNSQALTSVGAIGCGAITGTSTAVFEGASVTVGKANTATGTIILHDTNSANTITLTVPDITAGSLSFTLPPTDGDNTEVLQTDGSGVLTWVANAGAAHAILDGSVHNDSVADAVTRGSLIYGNTTPKWDELVIGTGFLRGDGTDCAWLSYANSLAAMSGQAGAAFSFNDQNITNVGSIAVDSIISDGAAAALTITATAGQAVTVEGVSFDGGVVSGMGTLGCDAITGTSTGVFEGASVTVGKASTTTGTIILHDSNSANTITLTVPDITAGSLSFTLPPTDGDNTNVLQTNGSGVLTWAVAGAGGAFGRPIILIPQSSCGPAANFATHDTIAGGSTPAEAVSVLDFDPDASEYADFKFALPDGYAGGGLTVTIIFSMTSDADESTPHKVRWEIGLWRITDDGTAISVGKAYAYNGVSPIVPSALTQVSYDDITFTDGPDMDNLAAGEMALLRIYRDHDHGDDNATGDAELQMILIKETV